MHVLALTARNGIRVAEIGFVFLALAGAALAGAAVAPHGVRRIWGVAGGSALALAGVLLIVATHWGHFAAG